MKDFLDLRTIARRWEFDGALLTKALLATLQRRNASMADIEEVLVPDFYADAMLEQRWRAYLRSMPVSESAQGSLADAGSELLRFLVPLADAVRGRCVLLAWTDATGWIVRKPTP